MLDRLTKAVLTQLLKYYLKNLEESNLNLIGGSLELKNVLLRQQAINELLSNNDASWGIPPMKILSGVVNKIRLQASVKSFWSQPVNIYLDEVVLTLEFISLDQTVMPQPEKGSFKDTPKQSSRIMQGIQANTNIHVSKVKALIFDGQDQISTNLLIELKDLSFLNNTKRVEQKQHDNSMNSSFSGSQKSWPSNFPSETSEFSDGESQQSKGFSSPDQTNKAHSFLHDLASPFKSAFSSRKKLNLLDQPEIRIGKKYLYVLEVGSVEVQLMQKSQIQGQMQVMPILLVEGPGEVKQLRQELRLLVSFSSVRLDLAKSSKAAQFVGIMINKMLLGMWKAYAIRPDNPILKKKSSDSLIDILANKEVLQQKNVDVHFDRGVVILSDSLLLKMQNFGFSFLKFSELKRMKMFLPKSFILFSNSSALFKFWEQNDIIEQDDDSDGLLSQKTFVLTEAEQKKSFFQSSLHNRKIEITISQSSKLKVELEIQGMIKNIQSLLRIMGKLSASIFDSLDQTWVQLGYVGQHAGPSNQFKSISIYLSQQKWIFTDLKDSSFIFKDVTLQIHNYKFVRFEAKRLGLVPFRNICLKSGHLIIKANEENQGIGLNSTLCEIEINCDSLISNLKLFQQFMGKIIKFIPSGSSQKNSSKLIPQFNAKINIISIKLCKDTKYSDFESLVILQLSRFTLKKSETYKLETLFQVKYQSLLNMSEDYLMQDGHALLEYSNEFSISIDKLKLQLDIERLSVLKLLVASLYERKTSESGIIFINNTQFEIQIKDEFILGLRKFCNFQNIGSFQKTRWVPIAYQNVQNALIVKVFEFDEFQINGFHSILKLLLFDSLVEAQQQQIELHSFKTQQLLTIILKTSFNFQNASFQIEFCQQFLIKNELSNQYCLELGNVKIKDEFPFSVIRSLRKAEPKLLHQRITLRNMNLTKIHETQLKSFNLEKMIVRKQCVSLSHNIIASFRSVEKKEKQQILEIQP